jgi:hypothetical protein
MDCRYDHIKIGSEFCCAFLLAAAFLCVVGASSASAQISPSVLFVPLIGITSVPDPLALQEGPGNVTYNYAVKNFLREFPLSGIRVVDSNCRPAVFTEGDDNGNGLLDWSETWRYSCTTKVSTTTQSVATVTGAAGGVTATHSAYATVVVGSNIPAPLVSIVNITKVANPLSLPPGGGRITFTYRVNNPGVVPLSRVIVTDDKCSNMSNKLGDTNGNNHLDPTEVWIYSCTTTLTDTTTNNATVVASANGMRATDNFLLTVTVARNQSLTPGLPETGADPNDYRTWWGIMAGVLAMSLVVFAATRKQQKKP